MGEEVKMSEYEAIGDGDVNGGEDDRVLDWEMGLPNGEELTPLSQPLIPPELALAFSISLEPARTIDDVNRVARSTLSTLRNGSHASSGMVVATVVEAEEDRVGSSWAGSDPKKQKKSDGGGADAVAEEADSVMGDPVARMLKRPRLVWTPQLHKRFVEVVAHLGIKNAVPKTIMQLMNVEGLTRENVASHLQKYRLYLKRMQGGLTTEGPSSSDQFFSSTPLPPQSFHGSGVVQTNGDGGGHVGMPVPVSYGSPTGMMPMPVYGHMGIHGYHHQHHNYGHDHYHHSHLHHHGGFESNPYMMQQRDWPGNKYGSVAPFPPVGGGGPNEK